MSAEPRRYCYPTDTAEEERVIAAPPPTLLPEDAGQRRYALRASCDALRWIIRAGAACQRLPGDYPPWHVVYDQARRWLAAGCFETMAHNLRVVLPRAEGRVAEPSAAILDSRTLRSTPESGARAGYDGAERQKRSKLHAAVDTLGHLLALHVIPADAQDRAQVGQLAAAVQTVTGEAVDLAYTDQGYTGEAPAKANGMALQVIRPRRPSGWMQCFQPFCCRAGGWSSAALPGPPASASSPATTSGYARPSQDCTVAFVTLMLARTTAAFDLVRNTL